MNGILFTDQKWKDEVERMKKQGSQRGPKGLHSQMLRVYGASTGNTCGHCAFLKTRQWAGTYFKCSKSRDSHSTATDWRKKWEACGLFGVCEVVASPAGESTSPQRTSNKGIQGGN